MPEPPAGVRSRGPSGEQVHRPDRAADGSLTVRCRKQGGRADREWRWLDPVRLQTFDWYAACEACWAVTPAAGRCDGCGGELAWLEVLPDADALVSVFRCPACEARGTVRFDGLDGSMQAADGVPFAESTLQRELVADGGASSVDAKVLDREDIELEVTDEGPALRIGKTEILLRTFIKIEDGGKWGEERIEHSAEIDCDGDNGCWFILTPPEPDTLYPWVDIQPEVRHLDADTDPTAGRDP